MAKVNIKCNTNTVPPLCPFQDPRHFTKPTHASLPQVFIFSKDNICNETVALGHKDQAKTGGRMPPWHLPIPLLRKGGTCTPSLWLLAHSVRAHTGYLS
eukprot:1138925-Pelagomonas_calceolata.AAC.4